MIVGTWKLIDGEQDGEALASADAGESTLEIVNNEHTVTLANDVLKGTHTLNSDRTPMEINSSDTAGPFAGQSLLGIFKVEADVFTVCFAGPGQARPTEFTTKDGNAMMLHRWKRQEG